MCMNTHLHLSGLILLEDKGELLRIRTCDQPQEKRTLTQRKLLEQICKNKQTNKNRLVTSVFLNPC